MNMMHLKVVVFFWGLIALQCFVHVQSPFQPLPTKLVFGYFDRGSYVLIRFDKSKVQTNQNKNAVGGLARNVRFPGVPYNIFLGSAWSIRSGAIEELTLRLAAVLMGCN